MFSELVLSISLSLQVGAHYFEEGNVELDAKKDFQDSTIFQVPHFICETVYNNVDHKPGQASI